MGRAIYWFLACAIGLAALAGCMARFRPPTTGIEHITRKYGIPPERVIALAEELGADPEEIPLPADYENDRPFPLDFFDAEVREFEAVHNRSATRADVEKIIRGYVATCETFPQSTVYFFYTTKVQRRWFEREVALQMVVSYREDPNKRGEHKAFIYERIYNAPLRNEWIPLFDSLENFDDFMCIKEYLEEQGIITPYVEPTVAVE
jgi:hypothetical protein